MKLSMAIVGIVFVTTACSDDFAGGGKFTSPGKSNNDTSENNVPNNQNGDFLPGSPKSIPNSDKFADGKDYDPYGIGRGDHSDKVGLFDGSGFAGIETKLVNISFEDGSDGDYNDVSFCFVGLFKVDGKSVVYVDPNAKDIEVTVKRLTGLNAVYTMKVFDMDKNETFTKSAPLSFKGQTETFKVSLKPGSKIQTKYDNAGNFHDLSGSRSLVEVDKCKNTGD